MQYTHFSPLTGLEDTPENYHTVTILLKENNGKMDITLAQDNNGSEKEKKESEKNWEVMHRSLKKTVGKIIESFICLLSKIICIDILDS